MNTIILIKSSGSIGNTLKIEHEYDIFEQISIFFFNILTYFSRFPTYHELFNNFIIFRKSKSTKNTISCTYILLDKNRTFFNILQKRTDFCSPDFNLLNIRGIWGNWKVSKNIEICSNISCSIFKIFSTDFELFIIIILFRKSKFIKKTLFLLLSSFLTSSFVIYAEKCIDAVLKMWRKKLHERETIIPNIIITICYDSGTFEVR